MINCETHDHHSHTNAFIDMNGVPYLLAEYIDRRNFQQIDRSLIRSEINIDQSESMRAVVDINVDDIGKRESNGFPAVVGNSTKQKRLLEMIKTNADRCNHQLNTLRRGIILRVNYQLENQRTGQVIRSMCEDLRITDRNYFLDINPGDINDNAIIVNFCNSMVSTINEFTHGIDVMIIRITSIQMFYECVEAGSVMPRIKQSFSHQYPHNFLPSTFSSEQDLYKYHSEMQNRHYLGYQGDGSYPWNICEDPGSIIPPSWTGFNRFYHFDHHGKDIILHQQEITDPRCKVMLMSCGSIQVNKAFLINPGHRIIFKFCIWKNDTTIVHDTFPIAKALEAMICNEHHSPCEPNYGHGCHEHQYPINPDHETMIRLYRELQLMNDRQNGVMNAMMTRMDIMADQISGLLPPVIDPEPPVKPDVPTEPEEPVDPPIEIPPAEDNS